MAWLIGHRATVKGQLDRAEALLATLPQRIATYRSDLAAIDAVIPKHRVQVDPAAIRGKRVYGARICSNGQMTREILRALREAAPHPLFTPEIAYRVARVAGADVSVLGEAALMDRVGRRLRALVCQGFIHRHHAAATTGPGSWSLVSTDGEQDQ